jgi:hypothetical protein
MASKPAAEPRIRLLTIFIVKPPSCSVGKVPDPLGDAP